MLIQSQYLPLTGDSIQNGLNCDDYFPSILKFVLFTSYIWKDYLKYKIGRNAIKIGANGIYILKNEPGSSSNCWYRK